ncbi:MAG: L-histidine N(alpha)-methyltransferase [Candidatus Goldiibacteriota bacterium]
MQQQADTAQLSGIVMEDHVQETGSAAAIEEIMEGLNRNNKYISSKYFYDEAGSALFEDITGLPEYYQTRTEKKLIAEAAAEPGILNGVKSVIELGSGDPSKITVFFENIPEKQFDRLVYVPFDICMEAVKASARILSFKFTGLGIHGIAGDFCTQADRIPDYGRKLVCFFGGTIGNFEPDTASAVLSDISGVMNENDIMLLGADMVKDPEVIERAYNDTKGITDRFNKNILKAVNNIAGTDFDPADFEHCAFYNEAESRIEMHLVSLKDREVPVSGGREKIIIKKGEKIHTENSYKFTDEAVLRILDKTGLRIAKKYTDKEGLFSLYRLEKHGGKYV